MPTIHIHTNDDGVIAEIVANVLRYASDRVRMTIDNSDRFDTPSIAARAASETGRTLVTAVMAAEREANRERELARAAYFATQEEHYMDHLIVPCPHCRAESGQPCVKPSGAAHKRPYVHSVRRGAANVAATSPVVANYCMCSHVEEVHTGDDRSCITIGCDCPSFTAVRPHLTSVVTLDEM